MRSQKFLLKTIIHPKINTLSTSIKKNEESPPFWAIQEEIKNSESNTAVVSAMNATAELVDACLADTQLVRFIQTHPAFAKLEQALEGNISASSDPEKTINLLLEDCSKISDKVTCTKCGQFISGNEHYHSGNSPGNSGMPGNEERYTQKAFINTLVIVLAVASVVAVHVFKLYPKIATGFYKAAWNNVLKSFKKSVQTPSFSSFKKY